MILKEQDESLGVARERDREDDDEGEQLQLRA